MRPGFLVWLMALSLSWGACQAQILRLTDEEALELGRRVWQNEAGGRVDRLVWWNRGEAFASLGIGHFIWYPADRRGPFEESFPDLLDHFREAGAALPGWLAAEPPPPCPWDSREAFMAAGSSPRMLELKALLVETIPEQSRFLAARLARALPRILAAAPQAERPVLRERFDSLAATPEGRYALLDYVNFKGEGTSPTERYQGRGWGLLQVLQAMRDQAGRTPAGRFSDAALAVLSQRVRNAPLARAEERWLPGWSKRVESYLP
jgi:hypothetical protein